jgi:hypothetical protein
MVTKIKASNIESGAVTADKIASGAITSDKIAAGAVTAPTPTAVSDQSNTSTGYFDLPAGTTAQRPSSPNVGFIRYNTTLGFLEQYTADGWQGIAPPPTVVSVSPSTYNGEQGTSFTINGTNFDTTVSVKFITNSGSEYVAGSITRVNSSQLIATTPQDFTVADEPLKVKIINGSGLSYILDNAIDCGGVPNWSTASGTILSIATGGSVNTSVSAIDPDEDATVTYAIVSGSLPSGVTLNTSTGAITGTAPSVSSTTTYNFTISATDNAGNSTQRAFSIAVNNAAPTWNTSSGSLATLSGYSSASINLSATEPEGQTLTYSIVSGSLPSGLSLNTSTGAITGDVSNPASASTSNFTVRVSDPSNNYAERAFSITVNKATLTHVRWYITADKGENNMQASEFRLRKSGSDVMADVSINDYSFPGAGDEGIGNLIDGSTGNKWCCGALPAFVVFAVGSSQQSFDGYRWATANDVPGRDPQSWRVEASYDNKSSWVTLHTVTNANVTSSRNTWAYEVNGAFTA